MTHTVIALLPNRPDVLARAARALRDAGYMATPVAAEAGDRFGLSRLTVTVDAGDSAQRVEQLIARAVRSGRPIPARPRAAAARAASGRGSDPVPFHSQADGASDDGTP